MAKKDVYTLNNGDLSINDLKKRDLKNLTEIKFAGDNDALFWRFSADILNPKAEVIVDDTHEVVFVKDGIVSGAVLIGGKAEMARMKASIGKPYEG